MDFLSADDSRQEWVENKGPKFTLYRGRWTLTLNAHSSDRTNKPHGLWMSNAVGTNPARSLPEDKQGTFATTSLCTARALHEIKNYI